MLLIKKHEREFNHPEEFIVAWINGQLLTLDEELCGFESHASENGASALPLGRSEEDNITIFDLKLFLDRSLFFFREEFEDRRLPLASSIVSSSVSPDALFVSVRDS